MDPAVGAHAAETRIFGSGPDDEHRLPLPGDAAGNALADPHHVGASRAFGKSLRIGDDQVVRSLGNHERGLIGAQRARGGLDDHLGDGAGILRSEHRAARVVEGGGAEQARALDGVGDGAEQQSRGERLLEELEGAGLETLPGHVRLGIGGDHHRLALHAHLPRLAQELAAALSRHHQIEEQDVDVLAGQLLQSLLGAGCERHVIAGIDQLAAHERSKIRIIIDDENGRAGHCLPFGRFPNRSIY